MWKPAAIKTNQIDACIIHYLDEKRDRGNGNTREQNKFQNDVNPF